MELKDVIQEHVTNLLLDSESCVKQALLHHITFLCISFGRQKSNDVLLSHMITFLNAKDWQLRRYNWRVLCWDCEMFYLFECLNVYSILWVAVAFNHSCNSFECWHDSFDCQCVFWEYRWGSNICGRSFIGALYFAIDDASPSRFDTFGV